MTAEAPKAANVVSFVDNSAYDSDDEGDVSSLAPTLTNASGIQLGFDDGDLPPQDEKNEDEKTLNISHLGGRAYFPLEQQDLPPPSVTQCPDCMARMYLLVQVYAPLPGDSSLLRSLPSHHPRNHYRDEFDRVLYVFACAKKGCTGVRCLRAAMRNKSWAKEGRQLRKAKEVEAEKNARAKEEERAKNPFTSTLFGGTSNNPFSSSGNDFGSLIFGSSGAEDNDTSSEEADSASVLNSEGRQPVSSDATTEDFVANSATTWPSETHIPGYVKPRYIATSSEDVSSMPSKSKHAQMAKKLAEMSLGNTDVEPKEKHKGGRLTKGKAAASGSEGDGWSAEAYEIMKLSGVEEVFLAFQERLELSNAADQILRYEFSGMPLPFSSNSKPYQLLYKATSNPGSLTTVTRTGHTSASALPLNHNLRRYDAECSSIPRCPHCGSPRTFEMQLMPNLVYIFEKRLEADKREGEEGKELGWATVWCFVCSADCLDPRDPSSAGLKADTENLDWQGWREEVALVELED